MSSGAEVSSARVARPGKKLRQVALALWLGAALVAGAVGCRKREAPAPPAEAGEQSGALRILYPAAPGSFVKLVEKVRPSLVQLLAAGPVQGGPYDWLVERGGGAGGSVSAEQDERLQRSLGSGFILDSEGLVLTNAHVIGSQSKISARLDDGSELSAALVGLDAKTDLALLRLTELGERKLQPVRLGRSERLKVGEWLLALGNPFGLGPSASAGILMARELGPLPLGLSAGPQIFLQLDAAVTPAQSGGPLLNMAGEVVGVSTALALEGSGLGVPIDLARRLIPSLERDGKVARSYIGIYIDRVNRELANRAGLDRPRGALVTQIVGRSPAAQAGIQRGDIILSFDSQPVSEASELPALGALAGAGRGVPVTVWRDKQSVQVTVTPAPLPE